MKPYLEIIYPCFCLFQDLRKLYHQAGIENKQTVFLFSDTQVLDESFLEDINNILSSGEVPNLYKPEDFEEVSSSFISFALSLALTYLSSVDVSMFLYKHDCSCTVMQNSF